MIFKVSLIAYMFVYLGQPEYIFAWWQKLIEPLPNWLWKPAGGCFRCFVGQVCFWYYLIVNFKDYNVIEHLFFVSAGIGLSMIYDKITYYLDNEGVKKV